METELIGKKYAAMEKEFKEIKELNQQMEKLKKNNQNITFTPLQVLMKLFS